MTESTINLRSLRLRDVLPEAEIPADGNLLVSSCTADSRQCRPGDLFIALRGTLADGHDFAAEAVAHGAVAVVAERPLLGLNVPVIYVPETRSAYGRLCQALAGWPGRTLKVIGVTGTKGKTTTTQLIASVLAAGGAYPGTLGTLGYTDGVDWEPSRWTTPPAPVLASWLARMSASGCTHAVVEASSHALDQARLAGIELDAAVVTNVQHDHLDYHGSAANYRASKARLFDQLSPTGFAVVNADDAVCVDYLRRIDGPALTIGIEAAAEIWATPLEQCLSEQTFLLHAGNDTMPVRTTLVGRHNIYNCLTAAAVGLAYGLPLATVVRGIESLARLPGRLERLECGQPFAVFVDYAHTADSLKTVLHTLRAMTARRVLCVFGCGGDRDVQKRPHMGRIAEAGADVVVVTSDNPRTESAQKIARDILRGCTEPAAIEVILDRAQALEWTLREARPGDCVLIAGKGDETVQIVGNESLPLDDREIACRILYEQISCKHWHRTAA